MLYHWFRILARPSATYQHSFSLFILYAVVVSTRRQRKTQTRGRIKKEDATEKLVDPKETTVPIIIVIYVELVSLDGHTQTHRQTCKMNKNISSLLSLIMAMQLLVEGNSRSGAVVTSKLLPHTHTHTHLYDNSSCYFLAALDLFSGYINSHFD